MKRVGLFLVRAYQVTVGPLFAGACRFEPSCSNYSLQALDRFGFLKGSWLTLRRLLRCRPFGPHGYDPVPETWPGFFGRRLSFVATIGLLATAVPARAVEPASPFELCSRLEARLAAGDGVLLPDAGSELVRFAGTIELSEGDWPSEFLFNYEDGDLASHAAAIQIQRGNGAGGEHGIIFKDVFFIDYTYQNPFEMESGASIHSVGGETE